MLRSVSDLCETLGALHSVVQGPFNFQDVIVLPNSDVNFHLGELGNLSLAAHTIDQSLSIVSIFEFLRLVYAALERDQLWGGTFLGLFSHHDSFFNWLVQLSREIPLLQEILDLDSLPSFERAGFSPRHKRIHSGKHAREILIFGAFFWLWAFARGASKRVLGHIHHIYLLFRFFFVSWTGDIFESDSSFVFIRLGFEVLNFFTEFTQIWLLLSKDYIGETTPWVTGSVATLLLGFILKFHKHFLGFVDSAIRGHIKVNFWVIFDCFSFVRFLKTDREGWGSSCKWQNCFTDSTFFIFHARSSSKVGLGSSLMTICLIGRIKVVQLIRNSLARFFEHLLKLSDILGKLLIGHPFNNFSFNFYLNLIWVYFSLGIWVYLVVGHFEYSWFELYLFPGREVIGA